MENAVDAQTPAEIKLPKFLDISIKACAAERIVDPKNVVWAGFGDNEGRMIAQLVDLVFNNSEKDSDDEKNLPQKDQVGPGVVLVVATEDLSYLSLPEKILSDEDGSYQHTETQEEDVGESFPSPQSFSSEMTQNSAEPVWQEEEDFDGYPCLKSSWYIRRPANANTVVDDTTIVDTQALVDDVRNFLKQHSIPLDHFAKHHLKRQQSTLSDLMNYPKCWADLLDKGREIYIKLIEFLSDENLPQLTASLRRKQFSVKREKLPDSILESLSHGLMPSDKNISIAASCAKLSTEYLKSHCRNQIKLYNLQESVMGHPLFFCDSESEVYYPSPTDNHICSYSGCGLILQNKSAFDIHIKSHFRSEPHKCLTCSRSFASRAYLNLHLKVHTSTSEVCSKAKKRIISEIKNEGIHDMDDEFGMDLSSLKHICGMCWRGFISRQRLLKHMSSVHLVEEKVFNAGLICYVCRKVLKNITSLEVHMRTHTNKRPFECDQCEMRFQTKGNLQRHMRSHTGERPYACKLCPARFGEAKALVFHQRVHTGEKPEECKICGKRFAQAHVLRIHMRIHEDKMPYSCDECGRRFRQKANLHQHKKRHQGVKNHKCSMCDRAFLTKSDYIRHLQKHTGIKMHRCEFCMKTFTRPVYLRGHLNRLSRPTAPQCQTCNQKFCNDSLLKKHLATHESQQKTCMIAEHLSKDREVVHNHRSEEFTAIDGSENNTLLLAAKTAFNNEEHYIIAPMQSLEGTQVDLQDHGTLSNFQVLTPVDSRIPFSTSSGHSVIIQSIDLPASQVSDLLFNSDSNILTTVRGVNIPINLSDEDDSMKSTHEIIDGSDPNMQCAIAKNHDYSVILTQDMHELPAKRMKLADHDEICQGLIQNPAPDGSLPVVIAMGSNNQVNTPVCQPELIPQNVLISSTQELGSGQQVQDTDEDSKEPPHIIVNLELEA